MKKTESTDYDYYFSKGYETKEQIDLFLKYNKPNVGSLQGPDSPINLVEQPSIVQALPSHVESNLFNPHNNLQFPNNLNNIPNRGSVRSSSTSGSTILGSGPFIVGDPAYYFNGSITEEMLHKYLDKAIDMYGFFMIPWYYDENLLPHDPKTQLPTDHHVDSLHKPFPPAGPGAAINPLYTMGTTAPTGQSSWGSPYTTTVNMFTDPGLALFIMRDPDYQMGQDLQMLERLRPKIIGDTISLWTKAVARWDLTTPNANPIAYVCQKAKIIIDYYHQYVDPDTIFGAGPNEVNDPCYSLYPIPDYVLAEFGFYVESIPLTHGFPHHTNSVYPANPNNFDHRKMWYPFGSQGYNQDGLDPTTVNRHMDITQAETSMWLYWFSTQLIICGHELIGIGDTFTMLYADGPVLVDGHIINNGYHFTYELAQKIRAFATTNARRGIVLLQASVYNTKIYYDPVPANPLPQWQRQLIFDIHRDKLPINHNYNLYDACYDGSNTNYVYPGLGPGYGLGNYQPANYPVQINATHFRNDGIGYDISNPVNLSTHLLYDSLGGLHPQGWLCVQVPIILDFDNADCWEDAGCFLTLGPTDWIYRSDYGYDNITWFALQTTENRNKILKYIYYRLKCINVYSHIEFVGRKLLKLHHVPEGDASVAKDEINIYRANKFTSPTQIANIDLTGAFGQEATINDIWQGLSASTVNWVPHNFSKENVSNITRNIANWNPDVAPSGSLICVGSNKIFFIGTDGYIHGYIKVNGEFNGGTWLTVSPSYYCAIISHTPISAQVKASCSLVANYDGTGIFYIGIDGYIYGFIFNPINPWAFTYTALMQSQMAAYSGGIGLMAISDLIFPNHSGAYCIAKLRDSAEASIYCFYNSGGSYAISPPLNDISYSLHGTTISYAPACSLVYSKSIGYDRLYYITIFGKLYYYDVITPTSDYHFVNPHANNLLDTYTMPIVNLNLAINFNGSESHIYFIGFYAGNYILCLLRNTITDGWAIRPISATIPFTTAGPGIPIVNQQIYGQGNIAISADGSVIAFTHQYTSILPFLANVGLYTLVDTVYTFHQCNIDSVSPSLLSTNIFNSFLLTSNKSLYLVANGYVYNCRYEEDNCNNSAIDAYVHPIPTCICTSFPTLDIIKTTSIHGVVIYWLQVSFTDCGSSCNQWTISYRQNGATDGYPDIGTYIINLDCSIPFPQIKTHRLYPSLSGLYGESGGYYGYDVTLTSCCHNTQTQNVTSP